MNRKTVKRFTKTVKLSTVGLGFGALLAGPATAATIDVLVLYTPDVTAKYQGNPETRINHLFNVSNQIYRDSGVDLEIRAVHLEEINYVEQTGAVEALRDMTFKRKPAFDRVDQLREEHGADMVLMYRPYSMTPGICGVAWVGKGTAPGDFSASYLKNYMYSYVGIDTCNDYTTAHEMGHNMGLMHSRLQDGRGKTFDYALGYGVYNSFVTVMAYPSVFNVGYWGDGLMYKFSSPDLTCKGEPCGIDKNDPVNGADAVSALKVTTPQIAQYFPTKHVEEPDEEEPTDEDTEPDLTALQEKVKKLQAQYDQILQEHAFAKEEMDAAKADYQQVLGQLQQAGKAYREAYGKYRASIYAYIQAYDAYLHAWMLGDPAGQQVAYANLMAKRQDYFAARNGVLEARQTYRNVIGQVNRAQAAFYEAAAKVDSIRKELDVVKQQLIAAKRELEEAGGTA